MTAQEVREGGCPQWCTWNGDTSHLEQIRRVDQLADRHLSDGWRHNSTTSPLGQMERPDGIRSCVSVYATIAWDVKRGPVPLVDVSTYDGIGAYLTPTEARAMAVALIEQARIAETWD